MLRQPCLTLEAPGRWGGLKIRSDFEADFRPFLLKIDAFKVYDFYY